MTALAVDSAVRTNALWRALIYAALILFAVYYLLPLYVMVVNSLKPLDEIRQGDMLSFPHQLTLDPWREPAYRQLMLCAEGCTGEQPRIGEVVTVEIELPENPVFGRKCIHCQATVVRGSWRITTSRAPTASSIRTYHRTSRG